MKNKIGAFLLIFMVYGLTCLYCVEKNETLFFEPEEILLFYIDYWMEGNIAGMYELLYKENLNQKECDLLKIDVEKIVSDQSLLPESFVGFFKKYPTCMITYSVALPPQKRKKKTEVKQLSLYLTKNESNEWSIMGERKRDLLFINRDFNGANGLNPEEVLELYVTYWINKDIFGMYKLFFTEELLPDEIKIINKSLKKIITKKLCALEYLGIENKRVSFEAEYGLKVTKWWNAENNMIQMSAHLAKNSAGEWKIVQNKRINKTGYNKKIKINNLTDTGRTMIEHVIRFYTAALVAGDIDNQLRCFVQDRYISIRDYKKRFKNILHKKNRPFKFVRIEKMVPDKEKNIMVLCSLQVPRTWNKIKTKYPIEGSIVLVEIYCEKVPSKGIWKIRKVLF
ncbi:hypothetical protein ACFL1T_01645 [Chlamydiota bacterium]